MITSDIAFIQERLKQGDLIGLPTETVYGLAANIFNSKAVANIFKTKNRPTTNPLIVHVASIGQARALVKGFPDKAEQLAKQFWPGSLTMILPKNQSVSQLVTANQANVAIRIPNHPVALNLLNHLDFPLVAPSANPFNRISPTTSEHVDAYFPSIYTLEGGACQAGVESTIVGFEGDEVVLLRHGAISIEAIEAQVGRILNRTAASSGTSLDESRGSALSRSLPARLRRTDTRRGECALSRHRQGPFNNRTPDRIHPGQRLGGIALQ
jgi:L-threonylcarbamoyladenylate synthase